MIPTPFEAVPTCKSKHRGHLPMILIPVFVFNRHLYLGNRPMKNTCKNFFFFFFVIIIEYEYSFFSELFSKFIHDDLSLLYLFHLFSSQRFLTSFFCLDVHLGIDLTSILFVL